MCFSAKASFAASALLVPAGCYCLRESLRKDRRYLLFAAMPFFFGVQQLFEAFVWIGLSAGDQGLVRRASLGFLFFAFFFWPALIPLGSYMVERAAGTRKRLGLLAAAGLALGILIYAPLLYEGVTFTTSVVKHSILYETSRLPSQKLAYTLMYVVVAIVPLLMSTERTLKEFGLLLLLSVIIARSAASHAFFSVWCFLAAFISLFVVHLVRRIPPRGAGPALP